MSSTPYIVEPELSGPGPRFVRLTNGARQAQALFVNLSVGLFLVLFWASGMDMAFYRQIAAEGGKATATITDVRDSGKKSKRYRVRYDFEVAGHGWVEGSERIRERDFGRLSPGEHVAVTYLLTDPDKHVLGAFGPQHVEKRQHKWNVGLAVVAVLGASVCGAYAIDVANQRRLLGRGAAVPAVVVRRASTDDGMYDKSYTITYRYPSASGAPITTRRPVCGGLHDRLAEGSAFTVLRDPADSYNAAPYFGLGAVEVPGAAGPRLPA